MSMQPQFKELHDVKSRMEHIDRPSIDLVLLLSLGMHNRLKTPRRSHADNRAGRIALSSSIKVSLLVST